MGVPQILGSYGKLCSDRASTIAGELVVVDGNAVLFRLWTGDDDRRLCGGDYRTFVRRLQDFVLSLVSAGVKPFFVFDGSTRPSVPLEESKADSVLVEILPSMHLSLVAASLRPLNVPYFVAVTGADPIVAYMSRRLGAPVITPDTDIACYGVRTVRTDGPVFCSKRATLEVPVCGLDGSEIADKFGLTVPHVGLMKMLSLFVFPSERILVASSSELAGDLALDMAREQSPSVEVVPSHQTHDIRKLVSERLEGLDGRRLCRSFELVKVLGIRYDDDLRRLALTLSGEELVCLWTRVCADAEKDLGLREGLKRLLALPRPVFLAVRKNGTALRQLVPGFRYDVWQACGSFQFNHDPEPRSAGSRLMAACRRTVFVLCPKRAERSQPRRNKNHQLLACLPDIFGENVSDSVRFDRTLEIFYHVTRLDRRRLQLNSFPGWRRTVVACLVMWRGNRRFDVPEVFLQAAVLTHMHLSDMIELPENVNGCCFCR